MFSPTEGKCEDRQLNMAQCGAVRSRAWVQMEGFAQRVRELAYDIHAHKPLGQERRTRPNLHRDAALGHGEHFDKRCLYRQHFGQSPPRWNGRFKKTGPQSIGKSRGGWTTKVHMVASDARTPVGFMLSPGNDHDAPQGCALLERLGAVEEGTPLLADKAYEGDKTRAFTSSLGYHPIIPPKSNRKEPWAYDRSMYKRRNEVERLFRRIKAYRRVFTRYDKLDVMYLAFILIAFVSDALVR